MRMSRDWALRIRTVDHSLLREAVFGHYKERKIGQIEFKMKVTGLHQASFWSLTCPRPADSEFRRTPVAEVDVLRGPCTVNRGN
jgi:hypothetical protein